MFYQTVEKRVTIQKRVSARGHDDESNQQSMIVEHKKSVFSFVHTYIYLHIQHTAAAAVVDARRSYH
jgi:hypothetical protein